MEKAKTDKVPQESYDCFCKYCGNYSYWHETYHGHCPHCGAGRLREVKTGKEVK